MRLIGRIFLYLLAAVGGLSVLLVTGLIGFVFFARDEPVVPDKIVMSIDIDLTENLTLRARNVQVKYN